MKSIQHNLDSEDVPDGYNEEYKKPDPKLQNNHHSGEFEWNEQTSQQQKPDPILHHHDENDFDFDFDQQAKQDQGIEGLNDLFDTAPQP